MKKRGLISYVLGLQTFCLVCLKILLNLYKGKKFALVFFIETCSIIFKKISTINMVISLQIIRKIYYLRGTDYLCSSDSHYFSPNT